MGWSPTAAGSPGGLQPAGVAVQQPSCSQAPAKQRRTRQPRRRLDDAGCGAVGFSEMDAPGGALLGQLVVAVQHAAAALRRRQILQVGPHLRLAGARLAHVQGLQGAMMGGQQRRLTWRVERRRRGGGAAVGGGCRDAADQLRCTQASLACKPRSSSVLAMASSLGLVVGGVTTTSWNAMATWPMAGTEWGALGRPGRGEWHRRQVAARWRRRWSEGAWCSCSHRIWPGAS